MKRQEAIECLEKEIALCTAGPAINGCPMTEDWKRTIDVCTLAIAALREQEEQETNRVEIDMVNPLTNADRIRAMSDEELCKLLMSTPDVICEGNGYPEKCNNRCAECIAKWLQQPAEGE